MNIQYFTYESLTPLRAKKEEISLEALHCCSLKGSGWADWNKNQIAMDAL